jgi:hypothetical protein
MKKILIAILLFFVGIYFLLNTYFSDIQINRYDNLQQVKEDKAIEKGWVPALIPPSAYDIEETHDIDTNQLFGRFYYKKKDEETLMNALSSFPENNGTYTCKSFLFKINTEKQMVRYRNRPIQ